MGNILCPHRLILRPMPWSHGQVLPFGMNGRDLWKWQEGQADAETCQSPKIKTNLRRANPERCRLKDVGKASVIETAKGSGNPMAGTGEAGSDWKRMCYQGRKPQESGRHFKVLGSRRGRL